MGAAIVVALEGVFAVDVESGGRILMEAKGVVPDYAVAHIDKLYAFRGRSVSAASWISRF